MVKPTYVTEAHYNGKCSWIECVLHEGSVCLPVANVLISEPFGQVRAEAEDIEKLPPHYPYLFSKRTNKIFREHGKFLGDELLWLSRVSNLATYPPTARVIKRNWRNQ